MHDLESVVSAVASARKYRWLAEETIRRVAEKEARSGRDLKAVVKATKRRLHQIYGAFMPGLDSDGLGRGLEAAYASQKREEIEAACRNALVLHQSTCERVPILDRFYLDLWAVTGRPRSVLDLGCGLNPLTLPWMGLQESAPYIALDIDRELVGLLNRYFAIAGREPLARCQDILVRAPDDEADLALLLKMSPTLERQEPGATVRLIEAVRAPHVVVSFAVTSLGGRQKGMAANYERLLLDALDRRPWSVTKLSYKTELAFVVKHD